MNTGTTVFLAVAIAAFLLFDGVFREWDLSLALARRFEGLLNWMAIWR